MKRGREDDNCGAWDRLVRFRFYEPLTAVDPHGPFDELLVPTVLPMAPVTTVFFRVDDQGRLRRVEGMAGIRFSN